jgi:hypothetical protein
MSTIHTSKGVLGAIFDSRKRMAAAIVVCSLAFGMSGLSTLALRYALLTVLGFVLLSLLAAGVGMAQLFESPRTAVRWFASFVLLASVAAGVLLMNALTVGLILTISPR